MLPHTIYLIHYMAHMVVEMYAIDAGGAQHIRLQLININKQTDGKTAANSHI